MELIYVTSNQKKFQACFNVLKKDDIIVKCEKLDIDEIQGDALSVSINKAKSAYNILKKPLIVNDSSFCIEKLNNFPSVYASYVEKVLGEDGILKLLENETNRNCYYEDILVYIDEFHVKYFKSKTHGKISTNKIDGDFYPYDKIFIPNGYNHPLAHYSLDIIDSIYQNQTYYDLVKYLKKRKVARGITFINSKVLLLYREVKDKDGNYKKYYSIPGGGVENNETVYDTVIREVKEEMQIDVSVLKFLGIDEYDDGVCYYFITKYLSGTPTLGGEELVKNNPDNFYQVSYIDINEINNIFIFGRGKEMIINAYNYFKNIK